jgi:hypothetical protein
LGTIFRVTFAVLYRRIWSIVGKYSILCCDIYPCHLSILCCFYYQHCTKLLKLDHGTCIHIKGGTCICIQVEDETYTCILDGNSKYGIITSIGTLNTKCNGNLNSPYNVMHPNGSLNLHHMMICMQRLDEETYSYIHIDI